MAANINLTIPRGDDIIINLTLTLNGVAVNITGYKFYFTAKVNSIDLDSAAVIQQDWTTHTNPTLGQTALVLTSSQTNIGVGSYAYDIQYKDGSDKITTLVTGILTIAQDITLRTS